jgi:RNA polymerase sigma-70 factor (ECF subfamily)
VTAPVLDDWDLVALARTDPAAFARLWERHRGPVFGYVLPRVGHCRELAEDITSETFVRALRGLHGVQRTASPFAAWLFTIARNVMLDHHKRRSTRFERLVDELPEVHIPGQRCDTDAVDAAVTLRGCLAGMSAADQAVLVGRYVHGLSWAEVAAADGRSVNAIKAQRHRAMARLRRRLDVEQEAV